MLAITSYTELSFDGKVIRPFNCHGLNTKYMVKIEGCKHKFIDINSAKYPCWRMDIISMYFDEDDDVWVTNGVSEYSEAVDSAKVYMVHPHEPTIGIFLDHLEREIKAVKTKDVTSPYRTLDRNSIHPQLVYDYIQALDLKRYAYLSTTGSFLAAYDDWGSRYYQTCKLAAYLCSHHRNQIRYSEYFANL
jgi:hypothetical protein